MNKFLMLLGGVLLAGAGAASLQAGTGSDLPVEIESLSRLDEEVAHRTLDIQHWQTAEGAKVLFVAAPELPMFDLRLTFAAGSSRDGGTAGLAFLTNAMLNEGIPGKDVTEIAAAFEGLGAQFSNGSYRDMAILGLRSLSAEKIRQPALDLFTQVAGQPTFPADALARIRNQLMSSFEQRKQDPGKLASIELFQKLYADSHPYAHPSKGTPESVQGISREQLVEFHRQAYGAGNVVIALVGDLSREAAERIASQVSAALPDSPALASLPRPVPPAPGRYRIDYPSQQTHLLLAQLGIARNDPDYAALYLGNQILGGGGFGSRLMEEVREKRGLTYGIYSGFSPMSVAGPFMVHLQTRAEMTEGTLELIQQLVADFIEQGPTEEELRKNQREVAGSFPLANASNADIVGQLGSIGFYDLPLDYLESFMESIQQLTVADVRDAMQRHLSPEQFVIVSAGPQVEQQPLPAPTRHPQPHAETVPES